MGCHDCGWWTYFDILKWKLTYSRTCRYVQNVCTIKTVGLAAIYILFNPSYFLIIVPKVAYYVELSPNRPNLDRKMLIIALILDGCLKKLLHIGFLGRWIQLSCQFLSVRNSLFGFYIFIIFIAYLPYKMDP